METKKGRERKERRLWNKEKENNFSDLVGRKDEKRDTEEREGEEKYVGGSKGRKEKVCLLLFNKENKKERKKERKVEKKVHFPIF